MATALQKLQEEFNIPCRNRQKVDSYHRWYGWLHLDIIDRMRREFKVECTVGAQWYLTVKPSNNQLRSTR